MTEREGVEGRLITRKTDAHLRPLHKSSLPEKCPPYLFGGPRYVYTRITIAEVDCKGKTICVSFFREGDDSREKVF